MESMTVEYIGDLRTKATHLKSGTVFYTDAPIDNQGKGESFSPTDICSFSLASCMLTIIGIACKTHNFSIDGAFARITKVMNPNPRFIAEIIVDIDFPKNHYSEKEKTIIKRITETCPVALSLDEKVRQTIILNF